MNPVREGELRKAQQAIAANPKPKSVPKPETVVQRSDHRPSSNGNHQRQNSAFIEVPAGKAATPQGFSVDEDGVWRLVQLPIKEGETTRVKEERQWICAPLEVVAYARTPDKDDWGKLLRFRDPEHVAHRWVMPSAMLAKDTSQFRGKLLSMGLKISASRSAPDNLRQYLQMSEPEIYARTVERIGWFGGTFVLPDENIGPENAEMILLQSPREMKHRLKTAGGVDEWRDDASSLCSGNTRLLFAVSCSAAAALLYFFREQSGGFHFVSDSTAGKTTILTVAGSFWGGGGHNGFVESWLTTASALENTAEWHNNVLLLLDELKMIDPIDASKVAYSLSNGMSKARMDRTTRSHRRAEWQLLYLSAGELNLEQHLETVQKRTYGGQEVRFCAIPAIVHDTNGAFENLHDFKSAKLFSEHLMNASRTCYGAASREFLRHLVRMGHDQARQMIQRHRRRFVDQYVPGNAAPAVARAADRFSLVAAAGELLTALGITAWKPGEAESGSGVCFQDWLAQRGTDGNWDEQQAIKTLKTTLLVHGNSRFQFYKCRADRRSAGEDDSIKVLNRLGFRCLTPSESWSSEDEPEYEYQILPDNFQNVCGAFPQELVLRALQKRKLLLGTDQEHLTAQRTVPEIGRTRVYAISSRIFQGENETRGENASGTGAGG